MTEVKIVNGYNVIEYAKNNIYVIENIFDNDLCNDLITLIQKVHLTKQMYHKRNNVACYMTRMEDLLEVDDRHYYTFPTNITDYNKQLDNVSKKKIITTNKLDGLSHTDIITFNRKICDKISILAEIMKNVNARLKFNINSGLLLRKIYGETKIHSDGIYDKLTTANVSCITDSGKDGTNIYCRQSSCIFALNDDHDGGIFEFPHQDVSIKLKKGSIIIFPPYWTHPHRVTELNNTFRYTLSCWFCEKLE